MLQEIHAADQIDAQQDRTSTSTANTQGQYSTLCEQVLARELLTSRCDQRLHILRCSKTDGQISQKLIQKAVGWIEVTGFTKNLQFDTILLSISLFYASLNTLQVQKSNLQAIICSCILMACKMTSRDQLSMSDVLSLISHRQNQKNILQQQKQILLSLDFNLHFQFPLLDLISSRLVHEQHQQKAKFITEVLLLKQPAILYDFDKIQQVLELCQQSRLGSTKLATKISKMLKKSTCQHLLNKYQAKFNVGHYIIQDDFVSNYI